MRGASSKQSNQPDKRNIRIVTQLQYMHATCEMLQRGPPTQLSAESTAGGQSRKWRHLSVDLIRAGSRLACNLFFFFHSHNRRRLQQGRTGELSNGQCERTRTISFQYVMLAKWRVEKPSLTWAFLLAIFSNSFCYMGIDFVTSDVLSSWRPVPETIEAHSVHHVFACG